MIVVAEGVPPSGMWCCREDIDALVRMRDARSRLSSDFSRGGTLAEVLDKCRGEPYLGDTYVVKILEVRPTIGKVEARRLMDRHHLAVRTRIGELSSSAVLAIDEDLRRRIDERTGDDREIGRSSV